MLKNGEIIRKFHKIKSLFAFFKIDISFLITFIIACFIEEVFIYVCFVVSLILHELCHYAVAKKHGYMASRIHLTFFGASLEGLDDFTLSDEIKIVLAGPLFNFSVIILCYLSFWFYPESYNYLNEILLANIGILLFNFLPIYPLDLGRLILAILTKKHIRKSALKKTKTLGIIFLALLFIVFLVSFFYEYNFSLGFVCVNLAVLLFRETGGTSFKREMFIKRKLKLISKGLLERNIYIKNETPLYSLFKFIDDYHFVNFMFVDKNFELINMMTEKELYQKTGYC